MASRIDIISKFSIQCFFFKSILFPPPKDLILPARQTLAPVPLKQPLPQARTDKTSLWGCPIRPTKLRFVVDTAHSPFARTTHVSTKAGPAGGGTDNRSGIQEKSEKRPSSNAWR